MANLTTTWADGTALCALMEAVYPGCCPRHDLLRASNQINNCRLGLKLTYKHLNIPQVSASQSSSLSLSVCLSPLSFCLFLSLSPPLSFFLSPPLPLCVSCLCLLVCCLCPLLFLSLFLFLSLCFFLSLFLSLSVSLCGVHIIQFIDLCLVKFL